MNTEEVHSAILVSLLGSAGAATLKRTGVEVGKKSTAAALHKRTFEPLNGVEFSVVVPSEPAGDRDS